MPMPFLSVSAISKKFDGQVALHGITFMQRRLQRLAIAGETGSGKSTLLKTIAGLIQPDEGEVYFEGSPVKGPDERLVPGHPSIPYLSQNFELAKFLRVEQVFSYSNVLSDAEASSLFKVCQIDHLLKRKTDQLSGGERQRIAICRLLISSPRLLLLDEPFAHLDIVHKETLQAVIQDIGERLGITVMLVSHDPTDILSWADKIVVIRDGVLVQKGKPAKLYNNPADEYVAGLFGRYSSLDPDTASCLGLNTRKRRIIVRPEHFKVNRSGRKAQRAVITRKSFLGNYVLLEVTFHGSILIVKTEKAEHQVGDCVYLSIPNS